MRAVKAGLRDRRGAELRGSAPLRRVEPATPAGTACACSPRSCASGCSWPPARRSAHRRRARGPSLRLGDAAERRLTASGGHPLLPPGEPAATRPSRSSSARTRSSAGATSSAAVDSLRPPASRAARDRRRRRPQPRAARARCAPSCRAWSPSPTRARAGCRARATAGSRRRSGEVVAFLDDDAVAEPDWLEQPAARLRRPDGDRRRRRGRAACGPAERPAWFPRRVRLGRRLHLPRAARRRARRCAT